MLLLKRLASFVIDTLLFILSSIVVDFIFIRAESPPPAQLIVAIAYFSSLILPIVVLGRPISYIILRLHLDCDNERVGQLKLLFKYIICYLFISSELLVIVSLFTSFLNYYTHLKTGMAFNFKLAGTVILLNMLCFIATFGQKNLIDLVIKIQYKSLSNKKKFTLGITTFTYLLSISIIVPTLIEFKINQHFSIATFNEEIKSIGKGYFPIEVFGNYLDINVTSVKVENTNRIVTPSEPSSFIMNMQLPQRQIVAFINEKVKKNHNERKKLCSLLLNYSYSNPWTYSDAMQTKFVLVNVKRVNPFASIQTIYTYYYDDKTPIYSFYGGYNPDSLSKYYEKIQRDYFDSYISILSKELELPQDTVLKYMNENGSLVLPEGIKVKVTNKKIPLSFKAEIGGTAFTTVPFEKVEPIQFVQLNFPPGHINYPFSYSSLEALRSTEAEDRMFNIKMNYVFSR